MVSHVLGDIVQKLLWTELSLVMALAHGVIEVLDKREDQIGLDLMVVDVRQEGVDDLHKNALREITRYEHRFGVVEVDYLLEGVVYPGEQLERLLD